MIWIALPEAFRTGGPKVRSLLFVGAGFGSGFSPIAPGTVGTVFAIGIVALLARSGLHAGATLAVMAIGTTLISMWLGTRVEEVTGNHDPGYFVLDEFAGYFVALLRIDGQWPGLRELIVAFFLFRLFDVAKPQPARWLQTLKGGRGIVLDDVAAGLYALAGVVVFRDIEMNPPW